jgi:hypothetical protein
VNIAGAAIAGIELVAVTTSSAADTTSPAAATSSAGASSPGHVPSPPWTRALPCLPDDE